MLKPHQHSIKTTVEKSKDMIITLRRSSLLTRTKTRVADTMFPFSRITVRE